MKMNNRLMAAALAAGMCVSGGSLMAQQDRGERGQDRGQGPGRGNFDPAQFRERMMERVKEQMEITDDTEWKAVQPLIQKVMDARMATFSGMGRGFMRRPGGDNPPGGDRGGFRGPGGANPDAEALQRAVDGKASKAELKAAIAKYQEGRKAKQAELEKAQDDLRKVLSVRQEAIATLNGWL